VPSKTNVYSASVRVPFPRRIREILTVNQSSRSDPARCESSFWSFLRDGIYHFFTIATKEAVRRSFLVTTVHVDARTDLGKVLAGIQVPTVDSDKFDDFLGKLGYPYVEETQNETYRRYLRG
jgi:hypothetical protein